MKTAEELYNEYSDEFYNGNYTEKQMPFWAFALALGEDREQHDKELTAKIKELKEEETNFHAIEVLDKIIKMIE